MTVPTCPHENRLLAAARSGELPAWERDHLAGCAACTVALDAERWMSAAADALAPETLPSPATLLLRARLRARRDAEERALRPLESWRTAALACGVAAAAAVTALHSGLFGKAWTSAMTPAQTLLVFGVVVVSGLPFLQRLRSASR